jgi:hypothetical protein
MLREDDGMKRVVLGVLVLAVCGMMVAPMGMAGKPGGGGGNGADYSQISGDFITSKTQGSWKFQSTEWWVMWAPAGNMYGPGGPVTIWNTPPAISKGGAGCPYYISGSTHGELVRFYTVNGEISINKMPIGTYSVPGYSFITHVNVLVWIDKFQVGDNSNVLLAAHTQEDYTTAQNPLTVKVESTQVTISGTDVPFHYDNYRIVIDWYKPLYSEASQDFVMVIDK